MQISFSDDAKASGDAESSVLLRLVGLCFTVKRSGVPDFDGCLDSVDPATNRATFSEYDDDAGNWDGAERTVDIAMITELIYV